MKAVYTVIALTLVLASVAFSQTYTWQHMGLFPPSQGVAGDTIFPSAVHGIAVDPDGKVWVQNYYVLPADSMLIPNYCADKDTTVLDSVWAQYVKVRMIHVYNPNGTEVSFSPIKIISSPGGKVDTVGGYSVYVKGRLVWHPSKSANPGCGLRRGPDGNIVATAYNYVYRINYKTGQGMMRFTTPTNAAHTAAGVDAEGNIFINRVITGGYPLYVFDSTGTFLQNARDTLVGYSRATEVSHDANDVYFAAYDQNYVLRYHNTSMSGILGPWDRADTLLKGFACESFTWNYATGKLWLSSGSYLNFPNKFIGVTTNYDTSAWYEFNATTSTLTGEKIDCVYAGANATAWANERPRAIGFSPGGDTAYVGVFGGNNLVGMRRYKRVLTSVEQVENGIPNGYALSQNFPNPFNPSTEIQFTLTAGGYTTLKVYDLLGKEITTLVSENLNPGTYKSKFDASRLASGTYIYSLMSNGVRLNNKMLLMK